MTKSRTMDEKFIIYLYNGSQAFHDLETPFNRYDVGKKIGIQDRGVNAICKLLLQANFIKNGDGEDVILTKNGEQLALRILDDKT